MLSIIIPVFNSEKTIRKVCEKISNTMKDNGLRHEIILVDDYSKDSSYGIMQDLYREYMNITCIKLKENYGQQNALLCGLRYGSGDYYVTIDDDLQNNPEDIIVLLKMLQQGYDVVYGISQSKGNKQYRNIGTRLKEGMFDVVLGKPKGIQLTSFRIMNQSIVGEIKKETVSYMYLSASILRYTKNIGNVNVCHQDRAYGRSNYNFKKLVKLFMNILIYYSDIPVFKWWRKTVPQYRIEKVLTRMRK